MIHIESFAGQKTILPIMANCKLDNRTPQSRCTDSYHLATLPISSETSKVLFGYNASYAAAWVGGILFSLSALLHLVQYFKNRAWFLYLMLFGTLCK